MKNKHIALIASLALVLAAVTIKTQILEDEIKVAPNSTEAATVTGPLNFQGEKDNVRVSQNALQLDTFTETGTQKIARGDGIISTPEHLYITENGSMYRLENGEKEKIEVKSQYGAVAGNFNYPGFNMIYANGNRTVYIRNLENGNQKKMFENALEVLKIDANRDGVPESAEIRLTNGTAITRQPLNDSSSRTDWDNDGYEERFYTKAGNLYSYDRKHGEEKIKKANSFEINGNTIYTVRNSAIERLEFKQKHYKEGAYVSPPITFNESKELVQLITDAKLNGGEIKAEIETDNSVEVRYLGDGTSEERFNIKTTEATIKFEFSSSNPEKTPKLVEYRLRVKD